MSTTPSPDQASPETSGPAPTRPAPRLRRVDREQAFLRPTQIEGLLPVDHRARLIWEFTGGLDLTPLLAKIKSVAGHAGAPAIDPRILLAVWLYALSEGIGKARVLDRLCQSHDAYRWILGGVTVNYHSLSDFRTQNAAEVDALLTESLAVMVREGLVSLERIAQDGMRVRTSAGTASFRRQPTLEQCLATAEAEVERLKHEVDEPPEAPAPPKRQARQRAAQERAARERLARVRRALRELPAVQAIKRKKGKAKEQEARVSTTDPEARVMKMPAGGFRPAFNVQFGTDTASQIIVMVDVINVGSDQGQLAVGLDQVETRCGQLPREDLVDGGYATLESITAAEQRGVTVYAPVQQPRDPKRDPYQPLPDDSSEVAAWRARMGTDQAKAVYTERAATAECVNAQARLRSLERFWVRGLQAVRCVALLVALTHNCLRRASLLRAQAAATN
jgi:transposase